jgi:hypothetical protein
MMSDERQSAREGNTPGCGEEPRDLSRRELLKYTAAFRRFPTGRQLSSYACLVPVAYDSGEEDGEAPQGRHVGHLGRRTLQWAFIEASHGAVKKDAWLREIYHRRTDNGARDKNRGYIAAARQLCRVSHACVTQNRPYRPAPASAVPESLHSVSVTAGAASRGSVPGARKKKENQAAARCSRRAGR